MLLQSTLKNGSYNKLHSYKHIINGFSVHTTPSQVGTLFPYPFQSFLFIFSDVCMHAYSSMGCYPLQRKKCTWKCPIIFIFPHKNEKWFLIVTLCSFLNWSNSLISFHLLEDFSNKYFLSASNVRAKSNHHNILIHNFETIWQQIRKLM
jgi:hypothetical protein